jgi:hypothetical protein
MKTLLIVLGVSAMWFIVGAAWLQGRRGEATATPPPLPAPSIVIGSACRDEHERLDKLARLAAAWVDTMSILRAENDSLRRERGRK